MVTMVTMVSTMVTMVTTMVTMVTTMVTMVTTVRSTWSEKWLLDYHVIRKTTDNI